MADATQEQKQEIIKSLGFFASVSGAFDELAEQLTKQSERLAVLESKIGVLLSVNTAALEVPDAVVQEREDISSITSRTTSRAFDLAGLGLIIPFLFNKESREYISSFANGLIGVDNVKMLNTALKTIGSILAGVFAYKVFKQVGDTIKTFKRLSQVISTLFALTDEGTESVVEERKKYEEKKKREKEKRKKIRENRIKRAKRLQKLKNFTKAFKFGGPIGLAIGAVVGVGVGTMIDLVSEADAKEQEKEEKALEEDTDVPQVAESIDTSNILEKIRDNIVSQFTLGLLSWGNIKEFFGGNTPEQEQKNRKEISGADLGSTAEFSGADFGGDSQEAVQAESVEKESVVPETPPAMPTESEGSQTTMMESAPASGDVINNNSETVNNTKKINSSGSIITINNIDTSTVLSVKQPSMSSPGGVIPSSVVGVT